MVPAQLPFVALTPARACRASPFSRLRVDRDLSRRVPRLAWETVLKVYRAVLDRNDVVPGTLPN